jgi:WD40 repeat protein
VGNSPIQSLDFDSTGKRIAAALARQVDIYSAKTSQREASFPLEDEPLAVRFDPRRNRLAWGGREGWSVLDLDEGRSRPATDSAGNGSVSLMTLTADGRFAFTGNTPGVCRWDLETRLRLNGPANASPVRIRALDCRHDGSELLIAQANRIDFLHPESLQELRPGFELADDVTAARFSLDGTRILVGLRNNSALWLDARTGHALSPSMMHGRAVTAAAVSPDGLTLLTGSRDGTARFWDARTGLALGPILRHAGPVAAVAFSPAGDRAATGTANGHAIAWSTPPRPIMATIEELRRSGIK